MDRRYYWIKTAIVAAGFAVVLVSGKIGALREHVTMARLHYSAAATVEAALYSSPTRISDAVAAFVRHHDCVSLGAL